jgi:hypothetical protein
MKSSELKSYIKEIIVSELSETTLVGPKTDPTKIPDIAKSERTDQNTVRTAVNKAKQTNTTVAVAEEEALEEAKTIEDKALVLGKILTQRKNLEENMKVLAEKWKLAEGEEKNNILSELKDKTKILKKLKKLQEKQINNII